MWINIYLEAGKNKTWESFNTKEEADNSYETYWKNKELADKKRIGHKTHSGIIYGGYVALDRIACIEVEDE